MVVFLLAVFLAIFIPGDLLVRRSGQSGLVRVVLAFGAGMVLWSLQGFIFGFLGQRNLTYVYLIIGALSWIYENFRTNKMIWPRLDRVILLIITIGVLLQLSAVWFLGVNRDGGVFFCCRGVPDDIYHLALTNQLADHFPPQEPGMVGVTVKNYHYLASLGMADLIRVFHLPLTQTVYQYFAAMVSFLLGLTVLVLAQLLELNKKVTRWWVFFLYFHGDILWLLLLFRWHSLNFDVTIFDDATKLLAGPPRSFSIWLLFTGLAFLLLWIKQKGRPVGLLAALILGSLVGFKIYTGIFALVGLAAIGTYYLLKKQWQMLLLPVLALVISLIIYIPVNGTTGGLIFNGAYRFENFIVQPAFGLMNLESTRLVFVSNRNWLMVTVLETMFAGAYLFFLYGSSLLVLAQTRKTLKLLPVELNVFLLVAISVTAIIGLFFLQNVGGLNSVQFLIGLYFAGSLYAALVASRLPLVAGLVVILLTAPRPLYEAWGNVKMVVQRQGLFVSAGELAGLDYLNRNSPADAVVALPKDFAIKEISLYVSFLAKRPLYVAGYIGVLQDHQVPGALERLERPDWKLVDFVYWPKAYLFNPGTSLVNAPVVFENDSSKIIAIPKSDKPSASSRTGVSVN